MRSHRSMLAWSLAAALAVTLALPARAQMKETEREWIEASIREAVRPFKDRADAVDEKKAADKATKEARDQAYLDDWAFSFLLGSFKVSADGTYTNVDEWKSGPGLSPSAATELDGDTFLYGVQAGWSGKPFLRDLFLLSDERSEKAAGAPSAKDAAQAAALASNPRCPRSSDDTFPKLAQYRCWKEKRGPDSWKRWAVLDALKLTGGVRFGSVIDDPSGAGNSTTSQEGSYFVGLSYELPIENLRYPFVE